MSLPSPRLVRLESGLVEALHCRLISERRKVHDKLVNERTHIFEALSPLGQTGIVCESFITTYTSNPTTRVPHRGSPGRTVRIKCGLVRNPV